MRLRVPQPGETLSVILKLAGETCNINCHYCYERRKPYPGATVLTPEVLGAFLRLCGTRPLSLGLHGGEPLIIGPERMRGLLRAAREYPGPVTVGLQTNAILLDEGWLDLFDEEWPGLDVAVSLDGDAEANAHRVDHRGEPTYAAVIEALELLERRGRDTGVMMVVNRGALGRAPELIDHFRTLRAVKALKLAPCLDYDVQSKHYRGPTGRQIERLNAGRGMPGWATTPDEYAEFLVAAFDRWRDGGAFRDFLLEPVVSILRAIAGLPATFTHWSDRKDPYVVTLYPDGRIGSSDELPMPRSYLGHVDELTAIEDVLALRTNRSLASDMQRLLDKCGSCVYETACRGGSLSDRLRYDAAGLDDAYCAARARIVEHVFSVAPAVPPQVCSPRTTAAPHRSVSTMGKDADFESFADAVRSLSLEEPASQAMYHASRVNSADWQRVEEAIARGETGAAEPARLAD